MLCPPFVQYRANTVCFVNNKQYYIAQNEISKIKNNFEFKFCCLEIVKCFAGPVDPRFTITFTINFFLGCFPLSFAARGYSML